MPTTLEVHPWPDPVIDTVGHDPRSAYAEIFWLPTLGPTSLLLLRRLATALDEAPYGMVIDVADLSKALGLGYRDGASTPLVRSFERLVQFDLASVTAEETYAVRRNVPPVNRRHVRRLPEYLQAQHEDYVAAQLTESALDHARRRSRRLALVLLEQGGDPAEVEHVLNATGFHPSVCRESADWAVERHRAALAEIAAAS
ncbi:MAG: hypothetical protein ACKOZL_02000 [Actinomycetes bacterium]